MRANSKLLHCFLNNIPSNLLDSMQMHDEKAARTHGPSFQNVCQLFDVYSMYNTCQKLNHLATIVVAFVFDMVF